MDAEFIEVTIIRPSSANARTLSMVTGVEVKIVGFTRANKNVYRVAGGDDMLKALRDQGIRVKKVDPKDIVVW